MTVQQSNQISRSSIKQKNSYFKMERFQGSLLIAPAILVVVIVMIIPLCYSLLLSFTNFQLGGHGIGKVVFLSNYLELFQDTEFLNSLLVTTIFSVSVLLAELIIGIAIAALLMKIPFGLGRFLRTILISPLLVSPIIVGLAWRYMYDPTYGLIYQVLDAFQLQKYFGGLSSVKWSLFCIMLADIWEVTPFIMLVATSGMAAIPTDLYEAGRIDGAGGFSLFYYITFPLLEKVIIVLSIIRGVDAFRIFDIIYALTHGGPANSTESLSIFIFKQAFVNYRVGYSMAISIITMVILMAIFLPIIKRSNENVVSMY
jgi:multiple sugar transport system permease protein